MASGQGNHASSFRLRSLTPAHLVISLGDWKRCGDESAMARHCPCGERAVAQHHLKLPLRERAVAQHHLKFTFALAFPLRERAVAQHHFTFAFAFPLRERAVAHHHFTFAFAFPLRERAVAQHHFTFTFAFRSEREQWHNTNHGSLRSRRLHLLKSAANKSKRQLIIVLAVLKHKTPVGTNGVVRTC
jgi:hypothetical protein